MHNQHLADQIWSKHTKRGTRGRKFIGLSTAAAAMSGVAIITLWPQPALAIQDVAKATLSFKTIRWTQLDEGTIRDLGSGKPATVAAFSNTVHHFASYDPLEIRQRVEPSRQWTGTRRSTLPVPWKQNGKVKKAMMPAYFFEPGPSKNLSEGDLAWKIGEFLNVRAFFERGDKQEKTEYLGKPAIKFHTREERKYTVSDHTVLADPKTKRMIYHRIVITRPTGEQIYLREQKNFVYDGPQPK